MQHRMERPWTSGGFRPGAAPLATDPVQQPQEVLEGPRRLILQDADGIGDEEDMGIARQPLEVGQALVEGVPVLPEVVRELQCGGDLVEEAPSRPGFRPAYDAAGRPGARGTFQPQREVGAIRLAPDELVEIRPFGAKQALESHGILVYRIRMKVL